MKAMAPGMIFAIILTIIVMAFVLTVGSGQIRQMVCIGSNSQTAKAVKDLESLADEMIVLSSGSGKSYHLQISSDAKICFVNATDPSRRAYTNPEWSWNPDQLVLDEFISNPESNKYRSNLWVYFCDSPLGEGYSMKYLSPSKSFCAVGGDTLYIENKGRSIDITNPRFSI